ncbi:hypothetical protein [Streptomyces sp. NPDC058773]|uniref:hypothetical protein n=1 Tax=Streptomyces sp. NPDC058773 TaxID=3346632 RepID=UPI003684DEFE
MPQHFKELLKQDFSDLEAAIKSWQKQARALEEAQVQHRHKVTGPLHASGWQGVDSRYAFMKMEANETQLGTAQSDVTSIATILDTVHVEMKQAQDILRQSVRTAEADGFSVDDHGNLTDGRPACPTGNADEEAQEEHAVRVAVMTGYKNDIQAALDQASTADWKGMQLLQKIDAFTLDKDYGAQAAKDGAREGCRLRPPRRGLHTFQEEPQGERQMVGGLVRAGAAGVHRRLPRQDRLARRHPQCRP